MSLLQQAVQNGYGDSQALLAKDSDSTARTRQDFKQLFADRMRGRGQARQGVTAD